MDKQLEQISSKVKLTRIHSQNFRFLKLAKFFCKERDQKDLFEDQKLNEIYKETLKNEENLVQTYSLYSQIKNKLRESRAKSGNKKMGFSQSLIKINRLNIYDENLDQKVDDRVLKIFYRQPQSILTNQMFQSNIVEEEEEGENMKKTHFLKRNFRKVSQYRSQSSCSTKRKNYTEIGSVEESVSKTGRHMSEHRQRNVTAQDPQEQKAARLSAKLIQGKNDPFQFDPNKFLINMYKMKAADELGERKRPSVYFESRRPQTEQSMNSFELNPRGSFFQSRLQLNAHENRSFVSNRTEQELAPNLKPKFSLESGVPSQSKLQKKAIKLQLYPRPATTFSPLKNRF